MKKSEIRQISSNPEKSGYGAAIWDAVLAILIMVGCILAFSISCVTTPVGIPVSFVAGGCGMAAVAFAQWQKKHPVFRFAWLLPVLLMLAASVAGNCLTGGMEWINAQLASWNALHEGGLALFPVTATWGDSMVFHLFFCAVIGELSWRFARKRSIAGVCFTMLFWNAMMLLEATFYPLATGFMLVGAVGMCLHGQKQKPEKQTLIWTGIAAVSLIGFGILTEGGHWNTVDTLRETTKEAIHEARYGERALPEGDFSHANRLHVATGPMLTVQTEQDKNIYLKAFVGSSYDTEKKCWRAMPDSAYADEYAGILKWLRKRGFDPLTQTALYYTLGTEAPDQNEITVKISSASREYIYAPAGIKKVRKGRAKQRKDETFVSRGLVGGKAYTFEEISESRPAELTVAADWVSQPETEEQKAYCEAESTYRNFVYDVYTRITPSHASDMQALFWTDYETESDGIYSALDHIRKVLKNHLQYTETPEQVPENEDPVIWGLYSAKSGNSMLFASVAVEAFRAHGIPARYVEGYYMPSDMINHTEGKATEITGEQAHAWLEVYFDGIGWLPVDVTPGYYYDAVALRQMISTPDEVHKSAALDNGSQAAENTSGNEMLDASLLQDSFVVVKNIAAILLGIAALLLILIVVAGCVAELGRIIVRSVEIGRYRRADEHRQMQYLQYWLMCALACRGVYATTGWNAEKTDREIAAGCDTVQEGEYQKINQLLEKALYGRQALEPYEKRTVVNFLKKITTPVRSEKWKINIRLHFITLYSVRRKKVKQ